MTVNNELLLSLRVFLDQRQLICTKLDFVFVFHHLIRFVYVGLEATILLKSAQNEEIREVVSDRIKCWTLVQSLWWEREPGQTASWSISYSADGPIYVPSYSCVIPAIVIAFMFPLTAVSYKPSS